jgi:hypothetical protein
MSDPVEMIPIGSGNRVNQTDVTFERFKLIAAGHYSRYDALQKRIEEIEDRIREKVRTREVRDTRQVPNDLALKELTAVELNKLRPYTMLCGERDWRMRAAQLNALMALMYKD